MQESKIKGMLLGAIAGDAVGTPFDGLTKAHIHAVFKGIDKYTDTTPALKGRLQDWKKPGLYSSTSQLLLLLSIFAVKNRRMDLYEFLRFINKIPETAENDYGIFRHPTSTVRHFLQTAKEEYASSEEKIFSIASARTAIILIPFAIPTIANNENLITNTLSFSLMFNKDIHSAVGALIFNWLLNRTINQNNYSSSEKPLSSAITAVSSLSENIERVSPNISNLGINPKNLLSSIKDYSNILMQIEKTKNINEAEKIIVNYVNTKIKTPVTRATIDHPLAMIPFAAFFTGCHLEQLSEILFRAAEYGGAASILCALTGALTGALFGFDWMQGTLIDELINKKRILNLVDSVLKAKIPDELLEDFLQCEASLTAKEILEKNAKLKHVKVKTKNTKKKSRKDIERELSAHVVESWTKLDKAKWRRKIDRDKDYE